MTKKQGMIKATPDNSSNTPLTLLAWKPWHECLAAFRYLACLESPGDFCHWRIYWAGTLTLLKTIRDVLDRVDRHESSAHSRVIHDFLKYLALKKHLHPIYWEFVCKERDNLVHEFSLSAQEAPVTTRPFLVDSEMSYAELAEKYGERKIIIWGDDGEDGLRLLELALKWWEEHLRIIEQATRDHDKHPFSSDYRHRHALLEKTFAYINRFDYDWERGLITPPPLPFS